LTTKLFTILSEKLWFDHSIPEKKKLSQLLVIWAITEIFALSYLLYNIIFDFENSCAICHILLIAMAALPMICTINGKINCSVNGVFVLPLVLYSFYFSDFNPNIPATDTIYSTVFCLIFGLFFLLSFS